MSTPIPEPSEKPAKREIRHLIQSPGYAAIFFDEETGEPWADALVGWALVAESSTSGEQVTKVLGLVTDGKAIVFTDEFPNFVGYLSPEGGLDDWREDVRKAWEEQQKLESGGTDVDAAQGLPRKKSWFDAE
jgi:hypothetical protein